MATKKLGRTPHSVQSSLLWGIRSKRRLAEVVGWVGPPSALKGFAKRSENFSRFIDKKNPNKPRLVEAPQPRLKAIQKRIEVLLKRIALPDYLHSGVPRRSYLSNSQVHCSATGCTVTLDVADFYPSIRFDRIVRLFIVTFECERDIAEILAGLLCCDGHLATGSPASPIVSFLANREVFDRIDARAMAADAKFTLYIDDIALTGATIGHMDIQWISRVLRTHGLRVKAAKTRLFKASDAKLATGRAFRNGISRAPNKQHRKAKNALDQLKASPGDLSLRLSAQGRLRHLALLDDVNRTELRASAKSLG